MRRNFPTILLGTLILALLAPAGLAHAAPATVAKGSWLMVPQSKDANGDGFIDGDGGVPSSSALGIRPSATFVGAGNFVAQPNERLIGGSLSWYLDPTGYPVQLKACDSTGSTYTWTISNPQGTVSTTAPRPLKNKTCNTTLNLPEGAYTFTLTVTTGNSSATEAITANVRNLLMVSLGDSYASGEGNPRNVEAWLNAGLFSGFQPYWDDDGCNRSVRGAPAQAALALERTSPYTSVTLVDVACSGATIDSGVMGPQLGAGKASSQIQQVRALIGTRQIDVATMSIGGNDTGFTEVLTSCAVNTDCPVRKATSGSIARYPTLQDGVQAEIGRLPAGFARIAGCLGGAVCALTGAGSVPPLAMAPGAVVLPTMYPDITRAANGQACSYLTINANDFGWARSTQLLPNPDPTYLYTTSAGQAVTFALTNGTLNSQIGITSNLGWKPVTKSWASSGDSPAGHGVCAGADSWVFGLTSLQGFSSASFHPNPAGQQVIASAIAGAASAGLGLK